MSPNRRIFLNIIATYGRSLYALVIGLFCGRWTLMALGEVDYGLVGVVGGLIAFVSYFQRLLSGGVGRFYALCIGEEEKNYHEGVEHCREWFTISLAINIVIPSILLVIGYPVGEWAVRHFLRIPIDRISACLWVWRFTCFSFIIGLMCAPFNTMYSAKQEIAEQTLYGFATTTLNVFFLYYAVTHPRDWLIIFAGWQCILGVAPMLIMAFRSFKKYEECRFHWKYLKGWTKLRQLLWWNGWLTFGVTSDLLRRQGMSILVNKGYGPRMNAAWNVGNTLGGHCSTLSGSLLGAFYPAIYNAWGAGRFDEAKIMCYRVCRLAVIMVLFFAIPLALEVDHVLLLWLKTPPHYAAGLCVFVLATSIFEKMTDGIRFIINANGNIAAYQLYVGGIGLVALPIALIFVLMGCSVYYVGFAVALSWFMQSLIRVYLGRRLVNLSITHWFKTVGAPLLVLSIMTVLVCLVPRFGMKPSFVRILSTACVSSVTMSIGGWFLVLDKDEKRFILNKIHNFERKWSAGA